MLRSSNRGTLRERETADLLLEERRAEKRGKHQSAQNASASTGAKPAPALTCPVVSDAQCRMG
jgi:hypothetical protein